ncbi:MAG: response regulator transcription factor [Chloroflexota bacterium]|nr:MAG: response regulator transcription factor [Chloroflexota bacterium]
MILLEGETGGSPITRNRGETWGQRDLLVDDGETTTGWCSMMTSRVLVLYSKSLFAQGIEKVLKKLEGLDVIGIDLDQPAAMEHISDLEPDAVIVDSADLPAHNSALILRLLRETPSVKVLCLSINDGTVDIYRKQRFVASKAEELVEALQKG